VDHILEGLDGTSAGIAVWDGKRALAYANRSFRNAFQIDGFRPGELSFDRYLELTAASGELVLPVAPERWIAERSAAFGREQHVEQPMADGRTLEVVQTPAPGGGMTVTIHDITDRKRVEFALRRTKEDAEASSEAKSRFLRAANHDLRQPLATLRILIYNCMTEVDEDHRRDLFHTMDISVSIMEDLLSSLLQIGQLDAGQIVARVTTFQLGQVFERLRIQFFHQAAEKGLRLHFVDTRAAVISDKALLERILANLLANAIRYTDVGGIVVGCRRSGSSLRVEICDSGRGMEAEHLGKIFDEFYQIPDGRRAKRPGLGLGLNIVKRLATLLGHRVDVRSAPGKGSAFGVTLPSGDVWQSDFGEPEITEMIGGEFAGTSILLIEDDEVLRSATTELLERWGIRVTAATSEAEAREHIAGDAPPPRLIIADYSLRGQLGTDVVRNLRAAMNEAIPAVIVTADVDPLIIERIKSEGFPVLIKPVSPPRLRVTMHNLLFEPAALSVAAKS
jgi:signal transduction histidine kinase/CheY-like chemotaxis protein